MLKVNKAVLTDLPVPRGKLRYDVRLAPLTWFRVGGRAAAVFEPADLQDLQDFLSKLPQDIPILPMGFGSNLLVRDGGFHGIVIRLTRPFNNIQASGQTLTAGAGAADRTVAATAARSSLSGLEFLTGVPGMIGGALRMNSGAYGSEIVDVIRRIRAVDREGTLHDLPASEMSFSYRQCSAPEDWVFVEAEFATVLGDPTRITARMEEISTARASTQPITERTGGSTFANPSGHKAWELVDKVGGRGLTIGDAQFSQQHANFMINKGKATAHDLETLGETVRKRVLKHFDISLHWEIKRVGEFLGEEICL